jgi:hypothetical protein
MIPSNIIQRATEFGTVRSRGNFLSFTLKILFYIIPAGILGTYTDRIVRNQKKERVLGDSILFYILLQTFIIISTLYLIIVYLPEYISEFQVTVAGGYFIVLYFGIQTNYIHMIQEYMSYCGST